MRSVIFLVVLVGTCVWLAAARPAGMQNASWTTSDDGSSEDCREHLHMNEFRDFRANVRGEETRTLPNQPLTITGERNGGIQVTTWDQPEFSVKLCKQAGADIEAEAHRRLDETKIQVNGSNVSISAPDSGVGTLLMVKAPRNASVGLRVKNGGVSLNRFIGTAEAHAQNGGISFKNSSGKLTAEAQNGGVSIKDCGGEIAATVENGGLAITLPERWDGKGLEAHTHNGGLSLTVPHDFGGGVEIEGSEYTAIVCKGDICNGAERTSGSGHRLLRLGSGNPQIHATTVNGGIVVKERRGEL